MPVREREIDELPFPICPRSTERSGGDLMFLQIILIVFLKLMNQFEDDEEHEEEMDKKNLPICFFRRNLTGN